MIRDYKGIRYTTLMASDVERDGVGLELHWHFQNQDAVVAEIFASDKDGSWTLSTFECDVPLELIAEAKTKLTHDTTA